MVLIQLLLVVVVIQSASTWKLSRWQGIVEAMKINQDFANYKDLKKVMTASIVSLSLISSIDINSVMADVRLNAPTAAGTRVNSDPESLLRYGLPIDNKEIRDIQAAVENIKSDLKGRRMSFVSSDIGNVRRLLSQNSKKIVASAPENHRAKLQETLDKMAKDLGPLEVSVTSESASGSGSVQERTYLDESFAQQDIVAKELSVAEELLVPDDFARKIPEEYNQLPALQGRAEVEFVMKKPDGSAYDVDGKLYDEVKVRMIIDGYNAPITGGNFVDLVQKGFYNGKKVIIVVCTKATCITTNFDAMLTVHKVSHYFRV